MSAKFTASYAASTKSSVPVPIGCSYRALNGQYEKPVKERIKAVHVECPADHRTKVKKILRACSHQRKYPGGSRFRVMNELWPYMTEKNKKRHRYMVDRHKFFTYQIGVCQTSQLLEIDSRIPGSQLSIRAIVLGIKDQQDGQQVFNPIDLQYKTINTFNLTYRPDKKNLAYQYCNSLSTYVHHLYPDSDLTRIFTLEAIEMAKEEKYHPTTQTFTTQEDIATEREMQNDANDPSLNLIDWSGLEPLNLEEEIDKPVSNPKLFSLSGDAESVSTMATDAMSVTFEDQSTVGGSDQDSNVTNTTKRSNLTSASVKHRMSQMEDERMKADQEIATLREEVIKLAAQLNKTKTPAAVVPEIESQTTVHK